MSAEKLKVRDLDFLQAHALYKLAVEELELNPLDIPMKHVELAALCGRKLIDAFCLLNGLEIDHEVHEERAGSRPSDR